MTTTPSSAEPMRSPVRPFRTPVRGHAFAARPPDAAPPAAGQRALLVREYANPVDPHAVAVWVGGSGPRWRVGYLDRSVAARLAPRLDAGMRLSARFDGWVPEPDRRWRRPLLAVVPVTDELPPGRPPGVVRRRLRGRTGQARSQ